MRAPFRQGTRVPGPEKGGPGVIITGPAGPSIHCTRENISGEDVEHHLSMYVKKTKSNFSLLPGCEHYSLISRRIREFTKFCWENYESFDRAILRRWSFINTSVMKSRQKITPVSYFKMPGRARRYVYNLFNCLWECRVIEKKFLVGNLCGIMHFTDSYGISNLLLLSFNQELCIILSWPWSHHYYHQILWYGLTSQPFSYKAYFPTENEIIIAENQYPVTLA